MTRKMHREWVAADGQPHSVKLRGRIVATATIWAQDTGRLMEVVEFWVETDSDQVAKVHQLQVFGTGEVLPESAQWMGTTTRSRQGSVWHLYELP